MTGIRKEEETIAAPAVAAKNTGKEEEIDI